MATDQPVQTQEATAEVQATGKTKFGFGQIGNPTPMFATWFFRIFLYLTSTASLYLTIATTIPNDVKLHITEIITFANLAVHGLSKMVGIDDSSPDYYKK